MATVPGDSPKTPAWNIDAVRGPSTPSFDRPVGAQQHRFRNRETNGLGSLEIDDKFEFDRLLDRKVARFGPLEDAVDVCCQTPPRVEDAGEVGHDPTVRDVIQITVEGRNPMSPATLNNLAP